MTLLTTAVTLPQTKQVIQSINHSVIY